MPRNPLHTFFLSIVIPSILAIGLFVLTFFIIVLPTVERNVMDKKKEMISELTHTAWSLVHEYHTEHNNNVFTLEEAQRMAASRIERIRYGKEGKDYFWIIDTLPSMVMHPYRQELMGSDLSKYQDPQGTQLFVEAVEVVHEKGSGFIDYMWQWKDDTTRIVPKLSYVKAFEPWGWVIGTGIYLEDVKAEIKSLQNKLLKVSLAISLMISLIILFVVRQSLNIENKRKDAENKLMLSRQKYKTLVEASTEGTMMMLGSKIIFANLKLAHLTGYDPGDFAIMHFEGLFSIPWKDILASFGDPKKSVSHETQIKCADNSTKDVVVSVSQIKYAGNDGYIIITKEISRQKLIEKETENLAQELQTSLLLMNQPIKHIAESILKCEMATSIHKAAAMMARKGKSIIFVQNEGRIIGVVNNSDLKNRVLASNLETNRPVMDIITAPVVTIPDTSILYEALMEIRNRNISHLGVTNHYGEITGSIGIQNILAMQQNAVGYLIKEIEYAQDIGQLQKIHHKLPVLVHALSESGDKAQNITRIITSVSDAFVQRVITLVVEELGAAPCQFAFMVMGSEGRMEQTLSTDQDNAIVFEDVDDDKQQRAFAYFQELGNKVSCNLNLVGYKLCIGEIMASNTKWVQPLSVWKKYFSEWIHTSDPQSILDACIFFDFRYVYGHDFFISDLRQHVNHELTDQPVFFYNLAQSVARFKPPVGLFGNIVGTGSSDNKVELDIKKIMFPIVSFIRLYALQHKINETHSLLRTKKLFVLKVFPKALYEDLVLSYNYLMQLRFRFQSKDFMQNKEPGNIVDLNQLTHIEMATLKKILTEIGNLQTKINFDFKVNG
jgi:signal-transduction protein with cAMP-binding, CBS, and nucleotidyltransferase domain/PAS domain-containing protein